MNTVKDGGVRMGAGLLFRKGEGIEQTTIRTSHTLHARAVIRNGNAIAF